MTPTIEIMKKQQRVDELDRRIDDATVYLLSGRGTHELQEKVRLDRREMKIEKKQLEAEILTQKLENEGIY